ncbi:MAG: hypothetical protein A3D31_18165 [Candidatus Fluviicola riflensis]|nr:MAG: hypothetical protein CHH17_03105 [Candidatus Fluviicola riflensis]OGS76907.1 MAG: hypothetical protein A3D31_18165 [Candidatus Fluviicola riflensis]OGS81836.1 MAG: hypothetical protein A2724_15565 [Fluviicola sp. RIFCSPHIGHO2_01_FULL_43_53]OGS88636.1 MAG: hypothetical protein A3E30_07675 [Fluviicola sp. RIFCSPHIGHO2_12_FULL_43_24]
MRYLSFLILLVLIGCSSDPSNQKSTDPATADKQTTSDKAIQLAENWLTNPADEFALTLNKAQELITAKGSHIRIPANAFMRKDGSQPTGKARLVFNEFQTEGEIIASGFPMRYKTPKGDTIQFQSAGMFEIRAYEGDEELELKKGKSIEVELATPSSGMYNFYQLDDNTRAWTEKASNLSPVPNRYLEEQEARLKELETITASKPKKPVEHSPSDRLFDIKVDPKKYTEFQEMGGVMWKYVGKKKESDPAANPKLFHEKYEFMRLSPKAGEDMIYEVAFSSKDDTITLDLAPVFPGKLKAKNEKRLKEKIAKFNAAMKEQEKVRQQQRNESQLLRLFNVDKLGVYNYDRQYKEGNIVPVLAQFTFEGKPLSDYPLASVYLIPEGKMAVIQYDLGSAQAFAFDPFERNRLIAVIGENEVYSLSNKEFQALHLDRFKNRPAKIDLHRFQKEVKTGKDLDAILASK